MKIRVGFGLGVTAAAGLDGRALLSIVDHCERLRWDSIWFSERIAADVPDPLAMMAAVAGRTERLKFGPSVLVLPGRNPVLLAKELATIDQLSGGRLVVAFGLGSPTPSEHEVFMVDRSELAARTEEAVMLIKRLWTEDSVTHEGRYFTVRDLTLRPRPVQQPHPDVWFGGHSVAAVRRVGRLGDGWLPSFVTPAEYKAKADLIRETAAEAGREVDDEHYGALVPYIPGGTDGATVLQMVALRRPNVPAEDIVVTGGSAAMRDRLDEFVDQGAGKFVVVPLVAPSDWRTELATLRETVAVPMEN